MTKKQIEKEIETYKFNFLTINGKKENAKIVVRKGWDSTYFKNGLKYDNETKMYTFTYMERGVNEFKVSFDNTNDIIKAINDNLENNIETVRIYRNRAGETIEDKCYRRHAIYSAFDGTFMWHSWFGRDSYLTCDDCGSTGEPIADDFTGDALCSHCLSENLY